MSAQQKCLFNPPPVWVLGAADREMGAIEALLTQVGQSWTYGYHRNGRRVSNNNAYAMDVPPPLKHNPSQPTVLVECNIQRGRFDRKLYPHVHVISDRAYGYWVDVVKRPVLCKEFMSISTIGKVIRYLAEQRIDLPWPHHAQRVREPQQPVGTVYLHPDYGWVVQARTTDVYAVIPKELIFIAAGDLCLPMAYRRLLPRVDPGELLKYRLKSRADHRFLNPEELEKRFFDSVDKLRQYIELHGLKDRKQVVDLTDKSEDFIPEIKEVAAWIGRTTITRLKNYCTGQERLILVGGGDPDTIQQWMEQQRYAGHSVYGDPEYGYAGAYITAS